MNYIAHTDSERRAMLHRIGVEDADDLLLASVPRDFAFPPIDLPEPVSEMEIMAELREISERNVDLEHFPSFLGAGAYHHFIPSVVDHVLSRSEFYTAYTPYQPEMSQGTLQTIFEYQSMICALTGMEVSNASHYDGATAVAEAVIMAIGASRGRRRKVVLSPAIHPEYRETVRTYTQGMDVTIVGDVGFLGLNLHNDIPSLVRMVDDQTACLIVQNPDFFGRIIDLNGLAKQVHAHKALLVVVCDPISLGMLKPPGDYDADIAVGEGQPLGNPLNYGGPYLGFFTCKKKHVRRMAGRLVGQTVDVEGKRGFVLTLATREQHIRRQKATSNICTNQGLNALAAGVYLAALGKSGLAQVARLCYHKAHYAAQSIALLDDYDVDLSTPFFKEFVVRCPMPVKQVNDALYRYYNLIGGFDLGRISPELEDQMLVCVTEMNTRDQIDELIVALEEVAQ